MHLGHEKLQGTHKLLVQYSIELSEQSTHPIFCFKYLGYLHLLQTSAS